MATGAIGVALSLLVFRQSEVSETDRLRAGFESRAEMTASSFAYHLEAMAQPMSGLRIYFASNPATTFGTFERVAKAAQSLGLPVVRLAWNPRVPADQRAAFVAARRRDTSPTYEIIENDPTGHRMVAGDRADYFPMIYEVQFKDINPAMGFDVGAEPDRRAAINLARDDGGPVAVLPKLRYYLLAETPTYVILWPVYKGGGVPGTVAERREQLTGILAGQIHVIDLLGTALGDPSGIRETIHFLSGDGDGSNKREIAHFSPEDGRVVLGPTAGASDGVIRIAKTFVVYQQPWTLVFEASAAEINSLRSRADWGLLALGLALTGALLMSLRFATQGAADETARKARDELRAITDHAVDGLIMTDKEGSILFFSGAAEKLFGYRAEDVAGRKISELMPEPYRSAYGCEQTGVFPGEPTRQTAMGRAAEIKGRRSDGTVFPMDLAVGEIPSHGGERRFVTTVRDITQHKLNEAKLYQSQKMEAVGQLTGGIAHDFNNILTIILMNTEFLASRLDQQADLAEAAATAHRATRRGKDLTQQLTAFSRRHPLHQRVVDVNKLVQEAEQMLSRTLGGTIRVRTALADDLASAIVDPAILNTAILNLALNARDAMSGDGELVIRTANVTVEMAGAGDALGPGPYVMITVSDTGAGMPPD
ncbi:MAG: CHASE domain-containing protein, partial [Alphaproteobacteria bacterium]|nr:CHASE domain-containing protein [Alphaproteobacteria bacterium]